jgi:hypothetical protein
MKIKRNRMWTYLMKNNLKFLCNLQDCNYPRFILTSCLSCTKMDQIHRGENFSSSFCTLKSRIFCGFDPSLSKHDKSEVKIDLGGFFNILWTFNIKIHIFFSYFIFNIFCSDNHSSMRLCNNISCCMLYLVFTSNVFPSV